MADPAVTYGAKVLAKGFKMTGDVRSGLKVTVPYLVAWPNVYNFVNAVITPIYSTRVGLITYTLPYRLPTSIAATPCYAQTFDVAACGVDGGPVSAPTYGLSGTESFFRHAIVTVGFEQIPFTWDATDDPNGQAQLDPSNPITLCEQSVKFSGKMVTRKGINFVYASDTTPVVGDVAVPTMEAELVLKFPHVPYLPWQMLAPYVNKVNSTALLNCPAETLLLEAPDTTAKAVLNGTITAIEQAVTLKFLYNPDGWNKLPRADGTLDTIHLAGDSTRGIFQATDFRTIFAQLSFSESA